MNDCDDDQTGTYRDSTILEVYISLTPLEVLPI